MDRYNSSESNRLRRAWYIANWYSIIFVASLIGLIITIFDSNTNMGALFRNLDSVWHLQMCGINPDMAHTIKAVTALAIILRSFTKELYIASYLLLMYACCSDNKGVAIPWLVTCAIRSIFVNIITVFSGCVVCANHKVLKLICLEYVIAKSIHLASAVFLWISVYDVFVKEHPIIMTESGRLSLSLSSSSKVSLESALAEAIVDWFIEEAERCNQFDSNTAVDEDVKRFEDGLSLRAAKFLELPPEDILATISNKYKRNIRPVDKVNLGVQTDQATSSDEQSSLTQDVSGGTPSEVDTLNKNPLRKFPYIILDSGQSIDTIVGGGTNIGKKNFASQTITTAFDQHSPEIFERGINGNQKQENESEEELEDLVQVHK